MSSTGVISGVVAGAPTTIMGEEARVQQNTIAAMPGLQSSSQQIIGNITEVHESQPLIKASTDTNTVIANGQWIPLSHSVDEIAARFGTIRKNMRVLVMYSGPAGTQAIASIIGVEGEKYGSSTLRDNTAQKGLFAIFPPGIGVG